MVTNHNKHNSAWNFLAIEGTGSRVAEGSWKPASTRAPKSCCSLSPACWPLGVTTPQHSRTRNPGPPFLPTGVPSMAAAQLPLLSFFSNPLPWKLTV